MYPHVTLRNKRLTTQRAHVLAVPRMRLDVVPIGGALGEGFPAEFTRERLLSGMYAFVRYHLVLVREGLGAEPTAERLVSRVGPHVEL